ncbi:MAG TPA: carbohydrate ABC transporter substrate-binding protein, partial [Ktedonobacteraceae bacterium]|nr:carbohydrate ABC transporter substrate-binding protein [Ktedonobacteraceae bacterium]
LHQKEAFYGGQDTTNIFSAAVKNVPSFYAGPEDTIAYTAFTDQLQLVESQGKSSARAWTDAQAEVQRNLVR